MTGCPSQDVAEPSVSPETKKEWIPYPYFPINISLQTEDLVVTANHMLTLHQKRSSDESDHYDTVEITTTQYAVIEFNIARHPVPTSKKPLKSGISTDKKIPVLSKKNYLHGKQELEGWLTIVYMYRQASTI